jgi:endopeptidase La
MSNLKTHHQSDTNTNPVLKSKQFYNNLKKTYCTHTDFLVDFTQHINNLYRRWIIDTKIEKDTLRIVDQIVRDELKIYAKYVPNGILPGMHDYYVQESADEIVDNNDLEEFTNIMCGILDLETYPFTKTKTDIMTLACKHGAPSMHRFCEVFIFKSYKSFIDTEYVDLFELYNKIFTPISIDVDIDIHSEEKLESGLTISKFEPNIDALINNCCILILTLTTGHVITFTGFVSEDSLNIYSRTSQIRFKHIHDLKTRIKIIMKRDYPQVDQEFIVKYMRLTNNSVYFTTTAEQCAQSIAFSYSYLAELQKRSFDILMKDFIRSDVKNMYFLLNLLLIGTETNVNTAGVLYSTLKNKNKIGSDIIANILYHNLPHSCQIKLDKSNLNIKTEIARIKALSTDDEAVSTEKKLAMVPHMPDSVKTYILEKNAELKSGEPNYKLQSAINGLLQFPWKPLNTESEFDVIRKNAKASRDYLKNVSDKLDNSVYGHDAAKQSLTELVGKWIQNPKSTGQVIGLVGPPGIGKTLLAKCISDALSIPLSIIGLGGMSDAADLIGHSFTYAGAQYGLVVRQMIKAGSWRTVLFFDEVDKAARRNESNEIFNTLIHLTDPNMNQHFQDRFFSSIEFDLSGALIVFSYNDRNKLDPILLDRIKEIRVSAYSTQEKIHIATKFMIRELCENIGLPYDKLHFEDDVIRHIIEKYTLEAGVRELKRKLEQILLKFNIDRFYLRGNCFKSLIRKHLKLGPNVNLTEKIIEGLDQEFSNKLFNLELDPGHRINFPKKQIDEYLGAPTMQIELIHDTNLVGVINGLYATEMGSGGIIPIQIFANQTVGSKKLKMTGNQKLVMKESVTCAYTVASNLISNTHKKKLSELFANGFHIHVPDGGTPKDGPSAGCAFTTAFVSSLIGKPINREVAMTGEIELTGKISKIGGLDLKLQGAKRAGVKVVYICKENEEDYNKILKKSPELFETNFEVIIVSHIKDIVTDPKVIIGVTARDFSF